MKWAVKTYVNVTLNWGAAFGCFAVMKVRTASGCVIRSAVSLQELLHSHAFYPEQSYSFSSNSLKANRTFYNKTIIHRWMKQSKNPLQGLLIEQLANKPHVYWHNTFVSFTFCFLNSILWVCVPLKTSRRILPSFLLVLIVQTKQGHTCRFIHKLLPSSFALESAPFQMRWMVSVVTSWSSSGWEIFSWGPRL